MSTLEREIENIVSSYKDYNDLSDTEQLELSMLMMEEDEEHWRDNDAIFSDQIKRMMLDIVQNGDEGNEKLYDMNMQLKNNILCWCEDDLKERINKELALKSADDAYISIDQEWDDSARERYL